MRTQPCIVRASSLYFLQGGNVQKEIEQQLSATAASTLAAIIVFYAPIAAVYALFYSSAILGESLNNNIVFYLYTYSVPLLYGIFSFVLAKLVTAYLLKKISFAMCFLLPSQVLIAISVALGRYSL